MSRVSPVQYSDITPICLPDCYVPLYCGVAKNSERWSAWKPEKFYGCITIGDVQVLGMLHGQHFQVRTSEVCTTIPVQVLRNVHSRKAWFSSNAQRIGIGLPDQRNDDQHGSRHAAARRCFQRDLGPRRDEELYDQTTITNKQHSRGSVVVWVVWRGNQGNKRRKRPKSRQ